MKSVLAKGYALAAIALAPVLTAHPALAAEGPQQERRQVVVHYSDLDLSQSRDAERLYGRIVKAARIACGYDPRSELRRLTISENCIHEAIANAVAQVNSTQLTTIHQAQGRRPSSFGG
jgi:UrcA family protein